MKKLNLINATTVLAGANLAGLITVTFWSSDWILVLLSCVVGAVIAMAAVALDKTA
jgi:uncharacterized membrane protein YeaQ/YmgE (transglycosylase-associated protein family)